jgi:1-acyl-sn-glycerol-3-phosphate acyltransferase
MKKFFAYPLSILYYLFFGLFMVVFHPIQWIALKFGGYAAHKKTVDILNFFLVKCIYFIGGSFQFRITHELPENCPLIFVSNHQSMNDVPPLIWYLRKFHPKFVSKKELGKGIPSVSFNLRHGGSVLIDRKDAKQSLSAIINFGKYIEKNKYSAVIFPEGTRSRDGKPKRFSENGLKMLVQNSPSAYVVPITINNSWKLLQYGGFPMALGIKITIDLHKPIKANAMPFTELFESVEQQIKSTIV